MTDADRSAGDIEHPTPVCPNCGGEKTRPLGEEWATCFDCGQDWMMTEEAQEEVAEWYTTGDDR